MFVGLPSSHAFSSIGISFSQPTVVATSWDCCLRARRGCSGFWGQYSFIRYIEASSLEIKSCLRVDTYKNMLVTVHTRAV